MNFQIGAALLDFCVLGVLAREDAYGYALTVEVKKVMDISESTLYPVLRRLKKDEHKELLASEWEIFQGKIKQVVEGEGKHE